jgi:hypothetical protein
MEAVTDHEAASVTKHAKKSGRCQVLESPKAPSKIHFCLVTARWLTPATLSSRRASVRNPEERNGGAHREGEPLGKQATQGARSSARDPFGDQTLSSLK